jgi:hypothetical protein
MIAAQVLGPRNWGHQHGGAVSIGEDLLTYLGLFQSGH